ncbi:MAG: hypothetical protein HZLCBSQH_001935 [Candidatus Fervidibacterota bacterium]
MVRAGYIRSLDFDPVTRVAGALAFHCVVDTKERKVLSANSMATFFRGYEVILRGRDPCDAIFISSRACGVCGGVHATCSVEAIEMAFGIKPPPLGIVLRNLMLALEFLYDHPLHLFLLAGPDYSQALVEPTNPTVWARAKEREAPRSAAFGFKTIGDIMTAMNPLTGSLYLEALEITRIAREGYVLLGGKYPHPETVVPGGVSTFVSFQLFNELYPIIVKLADYAKKAIAIWDDLTEFFYEVNPLYRKVGARPKNLIDSGIWDDPEAYDADYAHCAQWGERRWATPGVIVDGKQVTTNLQLLNIGLEEFVEHSYYEEWGSQRFPTDPLGAPLSPFHPWNKLTKPKPSPQSWKEKYSWATSPRWDRKVMEACCVARMWNTAAAQKLPSRRFIEPTGESLRILLPKGEHLEMVVEWRIPEEWNAFERNRGRAYCIAYTAAVALDNWVMGLEFLKQGKTKVSTPFTIPTDRKVRPGVGFWGAGRGYLTHHLVAERGLISNYQIITPSTWCASPRDPFGQPGPYEEAVMNTPILEEAEKPEDLTGIDILRAIRSFDPCMPCTTHIFLDGTGLVITREVNTCACGLED